MKMKMRTSQWKPNCPGLHYASRAYKTFVFSILGFINQLLEAPQTVLDAEQQCINVFAPGPYHWIQKDVLSNLIRLLDFIRVP